MSTKKEMDALVHQGKLDYHVACSKTQPVATLQLPRPAHVQDALTAEVPDLWRLAQKPATRIYASGGPDGTGPAAGTD